MSIDGTVQLNTIVTEFFTRRFKVFEPVVGNQALVITQGIIKPVKLAQIKSTAGVCSTEEIDARRIKCGVTFNDMKTWGIDLALCVEETCVNKGIKIYGGPTYYPQSSVCLAAEQQGLYKSIEHLKLVRISEIDDNPTKYLGVLKNNVQSNDGDFKDAPKS
jgi:tRNA-binding EMAP/Myf-like protein